VVVSKMDLVSWDRVRFEAIQRDVLEYSSQLGFAQVIVVPVSAVDGGNVVNKSPNAEWYAGHSIAQALETMPVHSAQESSFRMVVQWINRPNQDFRGIAGEVIGAPLNVGDAVRVLPSNARAHVSRICTFDGDLEQARPGQPVTVVLDKELDI